ncbi:hypothetical protein PRIPAC_78805 [Pristionchus pacificus]|nr:hypothetical protein PRIPAC_78805 [Pristionchus pacificus]|eukprot:PDM78349.1 hypothetical protein PRIPAC_30928 [Pristionchus pacificus]
MKRVKRCDVCLVILAVILIAWGIFGLVWLPDIYDTIVHKTTVLKEKEDESLGFSALMFSKPPMINTEKRYLKWRDDGNEVFYQNYKKWIYHPEQSCPDCSYDDSVTIPNAVQIGASASSLDPKFGISDTTKKVIALFLLVTGELPFNMPRVGDVLFDGYNDAMLTAAHSNLVNFISNAFNGGVSIVPFPFPDMKTMAYFNGYNNSRDEEYWIKTGKENIDDLGTIVTWAGTNLLPESWWTTKEARMINGTDTGSFAKPKLTDDDVLPMFHSYLCRSFAATFDKNSEVAGIKTKVYSVPYDDWDTTLHRNKGFRYKNVEGRDYFPGWLQCPKWNGTACKATPNDPIDCNDKENLCHNCCNKGKIGNSYVLPPGFFPLACYPGRMETSPFAVLWSAPHMLYSPENVVKTVNGMHPDYDKHTPLSYDHEPYSGQITHVLYRVQVNMPIFGNPGVPTNAHLPDAIVPMFYESSEAFLTDATYQYFRIGFVFMPTFLMWLSIAQIVLGVLFLLLVIVLRARRTF